MEPEFTFVLHSRSGLLVTCCVGLELAAILTRLRAASRFESRILVALLPDSYPTPLILHSVPLGTFPQITMSHRILAAPEDPCVSQRIFTI